MNIKRSMLLTGGILAAGSLFALSGARAASEGIPMPAEVKIDPQPAAKDSPTSKVLTYGVAHDALGQVPIPKKTLRITNNTKDTVYPIMRDQNPALVVDSKGDPIAPLTGKYNPFDAPKKEYRGYIGYQGTDKKFYYGLKPGDTILVSIPVVFWDAARMGIETGGEYLLHNETKTPNPLRNDSKAARSIVKSEKGDGAIENGVVMWYRADTPTLAVAPADDTEDQLVEWTIRDHAFLTNPIVAKKTHNQIPENQMLNLINYDVSNVDSLYLPVSMEVFDSWVVPQIKGDSTGKNWTPGSNPEALGWTGSTKGADFLQPLLRKFIAGDKTSPNELLGQYFGGYGWPHYNFAGDGAAPGKMVKIPSGANIFPQSPLLDVRSSYADGKDWSKELYMLSSGGDAAVKVNIGAEGTQGSNPKNVLSLSAGTPKEKFDFLATIGNARVIGHSPDEKKNPIVPGTTVKSFNREKLQVTLSQDMAFPQDGSSFDFFRPVHDYAAEAMIRLWFSWAEYYKRNWMQGVPNAKNSPQTVTGTIDKNTVTLTLEGGATAETLGLVEGMSVTGAGLNDAETEVGIHEGDAVILEIGPDKKTLILSQAATDTAKPSSPYTFTPPGAAAKDLFWAPKKEGDPGYPLFTDQLKFDSSKVEACRDPYKFSQQVYVIMAAMNQIGKPNNGTLNKYMQNIIGANMGYIFNNEAKKTDDAQMSIASIRDKIKSVLRGVSDFTKYPDAETSKWYPNPKELGKGYAGNLKFNVFNLDPFVWFVHTVLGFSGYGFSVDDDTADIGADGGTQLQVTITGTKGLKNLNQWSAQAPFGPVKDFHCTKYSGPNLDEGVTLYYDVIGASNTSPIKITTSTPLLHKLAEGGQVVLENIEGNTAANSTKDGKKFVPFKAVNVGKNSFELVKLDGTPTQGNGVFKPNTGRWGTYPFRPYIDTNSDLTKVFQRVTGDDASGTFQGTYVSVNGVDRDPKTKERFRVWQRADRNTGRLILNIPLTDASGNPLPAGPITATFFGDVNKQP
jgi:hypothetical protein